MRITLMIYVLLTALFCSAQLHGQMVRYSPYFRNTSIPFFQVAGKAGDYYWVEKEKPVATRDRKINALNIQQAFEVYDGRMNIMRKIDAGMLPDSTIREYLVGGNASFDQLLLTKSGAKTNLVLKKFSPSGDTDFPDRIIDSLPFIEDAKSFLLLRSPHGARLELIAFQTRAESSPLLHTILFDADWNIIHHKTIDDKSISQPCIQDDLVAFPMEEFDNMPVKLADNGEWMMSTPSRTNNGFAFFHGCDDGTFSFHEIRLANNFSMQDISLTLDKDGTGASVGILSSYKNSALRKLQVVHYSMVEGRFDYDSSFSFNTLAEDIRYEHIVKETLSGLPQGGYVFCKEYIRGDLCVFYFPSRRDDSTWVATFHEPQTPEMNWPSLSYLVLPVQEKLLFVYNASSGYSTYPSTTAVDRKGNPVGAAMAFWKFNRVLNFQHGRRITGEEVAVPYSDGPGFAIIHL